MFIVGLVLSHSYKYIFWFIQYIRLCIILLPFISVLKTLIHDPLVEWTSGSSRASRSTLEPTNEMVRLLKISTKIIKTPRLQENFTFQAEN